MTNKQVKEAPKQVSKKTKKLTLINVIAAMFTSLFLIDSLVPAAGSGASTMIWYLILAFAFYLPYAFVTSELSSKIPDEGGVYVWVKKLLGIGTAKRVAWYYWVNVGIWAPSIALYIAQTIAYLWLGPQFDLAGEANGSLYNWVTMAIAICFMWAALAFSYFPISENVQLYNSAAIAKIVVVIFLFIGLFTFIANGGKSQTNFSVIKDDFADVGIWIMFLPALVYNILGFEAIAGEASNIEKPKKTMPKAIIITALSLVIVYIAVTFAMQYLFAQSETLSLTAILEGLYLAFGDALGAKIVINIVGIIFLYSMFIETMGWVSGANAGIAESAEEKEIPQIFKWRNKKGMPFKNSIILGMIGTIELILFTGMGEIINPGIAGGGDLFWGLFAASSNILFLAYGIMFIAYIKGKLTGELDGQNYPGFTLKRWFGLTISTIALSVLAITYVLLIWAPGYDILMTTVPIIISVLIAMLAGELCFMYANYKMRNGFFNNPQPQKIIAFSWKVSIQPRNQKQSKWYQNIFSTTK